jgi:hypothetical protein
MAMAPRRRITTRKDPPWPDDDSEEDSDYVDDRQPDLSDEEASIISGDHSVVAEGHVREAEAAAAKAAKAAAAAAAAKGAKEAAAAAAEGASDDNEDTNSKAHDDANDEEFSDDERAPNEDMLHSGGERCAYSFITHK